MVRKKEKENWEKKSSEEGNGVKEIKRNVVEMVGKSENVFCEKEKKEKEKKREKWRKKGMFRMDIRMY